MHIPDGYLGPQTYVPLFAITAAFWSIGVAKLKKSLRLRQVPLLALSAAFCYVIMMFNIPIPGGTSGHAVGAVLIAILLGPWAAMVSVSLTLIVQALINGDGGITAIGANCFNIAIVMPFVGWWIYRLIAGKAPVKSMRHWLGGAVAGYMALGVAAIITGIQFGIQPLIARDTAGHAMYAPFGLHISVPMMALEHFLIFCFVEAAVTGLAVAYFQRTAPEMLFLAGENDHPDKSYSLWPRLALILGILIILTPLGLYLPAKFNAGAAWGEWNAQEIKAEIARASKGKEKYIPSGIKNAEKKSWPAPLADYKMPGKGNSSLRSLSLNYLLSASIGVTILGFLILLSKKMLSRKEDDAPPTVDD